MPSSCCILFIIHLVRYCNVCMFYLQLIAVEALVHATSKKDKCVGIVNTAIPILKQLYKSSPNDNVRVRALVVSSTSRY